MNSNLPPGCSVNDIPGNRPEDIRFENMCANLTKLWNENLAHCGHALSDNAMELLANWIIEREEIAFEAGYEAGKQYFYSMEGIDD